MRAFVLTYENIIEKFFYLPSKLHLLYVLFGTQTFQALFNFVINRKVRFSLHWNALPTPIAID